MCGLTFVKVKCITCEAPATQKGYTLCDGSCSSYAYNVREIRKRNEPTPIQIQERLYFCDAEECQKSRKDLEEIQLSEQFASAVVVE